MRIASIDGAQAAGDPPRVVGVLVLYYPAYAANAVKRMRVLLKAIARDSALLLVTNNPALEVDQYKADGVTVIAGDNSLREFSAWQVGLNHCVDHGLLCEDGMVVFANDTFCHHNKYGPITHFAFTRAFRRVLNASASGRHAVAGDVERSATRHQMASWSFDRWISSYLFAINLPLLKRIQSIVPPLDMDQFFSQRVEPEHFLTGPLSPSLVQHVTGWLFRSGGWYGATALTQENHAQFVGKAKSILCEMYLSACCLGNGAEFIPVFHSYRLARMRQWFG